jgi:peptide/nickel transport system permease protein
VSRYIFGRLFLMIPLLVGISLISWAIIRLAPGDPARLLIAPEDTTAEQIAAVHQELGLDDPLPVQYVKTMKALMTGDLRSFKTRQRVIDLIGQRLPTTLLLGGLAIVYGVVAGCAIGVLQSLRPNSKLDDVGTFISLFGFSMPGFWLASMLILLFSVRLHWFPVSGIRPVGSTRWSPIEMAPYLVMPTIVLGTGLMASVARYTRSSMLEALGQDYMRTARAKGLPARVVIARHALRNSLLPIITVLGYSLPLLVGGAAIVESIFALPGVGRLALDSVFARDYPVVLSINLMSALVVMIGSLLADVLYAVADPRIRYQ